MMVIGFLVFFIFFAIPSYIQAYKSLRRNEFDVWCVIASSCDLVILWFILYFVFN